MLQLMVSQVFELDVVEILSSVTDIKTIDNLPQSNIIFCIYLEWQKKHNLMIIFWFLLVYQ